jgi:hypothetical protein
VQLADSPGDLQKVVTRALEANVPSICSFSEHYKVATPAMAGAIFQPVRNQDAFPPKDPREDGAGFLGYGLVDVALGWPLRYGYFPVEMIETMNLDALGKIVEID